MRFEENETALSWNAGSQSKQLAQLNTSNKIIKSGIQIFKYAEMALEIYRERVLTEEANCPLFPEVKVMKQTLSHLRKLREESSWNGVFADLLL